MDKKKSQPNQLYRRERSSKSGPFFIVFSAHILAIAILKLVFLRFVVDDAYLRLLVIPILSFVIGFFSFLFTKRFVLNSLLSYGMGAVAYFVLLGFSGMAFAWAFLYYANALVGYALAFLAKTYGKV